MRLIAIDGSDIALENTPELKEAFGCSGPKKEAATALCSIAYGPLDDVIYDCRIDRYNTDERTLAKAHVTRLLELGLGDSLLLFDRWYPSAEFIAFLYQSGFQFVMRQRGKFNLEADAIKKQGWINLKYNTKEYPVRVLKVKLPTGEMEALFTSLNQKQLPIRNAGPLYFERWKIETKYDQIKSKASRNRTISKLRDVFLCLITEPDENKRNTLLDKLIVAIIRYPVPIVQERSPKRKPSRKKRFY